MLTTKMSLRVIVFVQNVANISLKIIRILISYEGYDILLDCELTEEEKLIKLKNEKSLSSLSPHVK